MKLIFLLGLNLLFSFSVYGNESCSHLFASRKILSDILQVNLKPENEESRRTVFERGEVDTLFLADTSKRELKTRAVNRYLRRFDVNARERETGDTLLHRAVFAEDTWTIDRLIIEGADPFIPNKSNKRVIELPFFKEHLVFILKNYRPNLTKKIYNVFISGPEVFLPEAVAAGNFIKAQIYLFNWLYLRDADYQIQGLYSFDASYVPKNMDPVDAVNIYGGNISLMNQSHLAISNMTRFRGPGIDGGTAFEMGYMAAQGKVVIGYYNENAYYDLPMANRSYIDKVVESMGVLRKVQSSDGTIIYYDRNNVSVENFGLSENLMMIGSILFPTGRVFIPRSSWEALLLVSEGIRWIRSTGYRPENRIENESEADWSMH